MVSSWHSPALARHCLWHRKLLSKADWLWALVGFPVGTTSLWIMAVWKSLKAYKGVYIYQQEQSITEQGKIFSKPSLSLYPCLPDLES